MARRNTKPISCRLSPSDHAFLAEMARARAESQTTVVVSAIRDLRTLFGVAAPDRARLQADRDALGIETDRDYVTFILNERVRALSLRQSANPAAMVTP